MEPITFADISVDDYFKADGTRYVPLNSERWHLCRKLNETTAVEIHPDNPEEYREGVRFTIEPTDEVIPVPTDEVQPAQ